MKTKTKTKDWWVDHPRSDLWLSLPGLLAFLIPWESGAVLAVGGAVAGFAGVVLGMGAVVFTLVQQSTSPRLKEFRSKCYLTWRANWMGVLGGCVFAAACALVGMSLSAVSSMATQALVGYALVHVVIRTARLAWLVTFYMDTDRLDSPQQKELRDLAHPSRSEELASA